MAAVGSEFNQNIYDICKLFQVKQPDYLKDCLYSILQKMIAWNRASI